jgi:DNA mismatch endonuclease, patch repair protein
MVDIVDQETRSRMMAGIRGQDTLPERIVRSYLHGSGLRFRLHPPRLPGRPDLILPRWRAVVFVHGCFWHRHPGCPKAVSPRTNGGFWQAKFQQTVDRDRRQAAALESLGWRVFTVWECQTSRPFLDALVTRIREQSV